MSLGFEVLSSGEPERRYEFEPRDQISVSPTAMSDEEINPYELLEVKVESTDQEIRTAYRQRSLKVHPDRVSESFRPTQNNFQLTISSLCRIRIILRLVSKQPSYTESPHM